jgi:hypothetical protein
LISVSTDAEVRVTEFLALHLLEEGFVVGDDDELEVGLGLASLDDGVERLG